MVFSLFLWLLIINDGVTQVRSVYSNNQIQGKLNVINGASAECVMHYFYTNSSWIQIEGEIGRNGIDGLYYKRDRGVIKEVLVAESKWNKSRLGLSGKNKTVKQMSQEWVIRALDKLVSKSPLMPYATLKAFVENGQYRARLFRLVPLHDDLIQISIYEIKNKGYKEFSKVKITELSAININEPKNKFEKGIVESYNDCRKFFLNKYLKQLKDKEIIILLQDNYIQPIDIN